MAFDRDDYIQGRMRTARHKLAIAHSDLEDGDPLEALDEITHALFAIDSARYWLGMYEAEEEELDD